MKKKNINFIGITILCLLVLGFGGYFIYDKFVENSNPYTVTTFKNFTNDWDNNYAKNKSYEIQNVTIGNKKANLYFDYTFIYEEVSHLLDSYTGRSTFTVQHGDTILYNKNIAADIAKSVIKYVGMIENDYLVVGDKLCSSYSVSTNECNFSNSDDLNLYYINYNSVNEFNDMIKDNDYYIYNISIDNNKITLNTLLRDYADGMWDCKTSPATQDIQRIYTVTYSGNGKFSEPAIKSSINFSYYCSTSDKMSFDWE